MKKMIFLVLFFCHLAHSQDIEPLKIKVTEKLSSLGKVWGFLKYYHPNVAKGDYNWDEQLLTILPKIEKATNKDEVSNTLRVIYDDNKNEKYDSGNFLKKRQAEEVIYFFKELDLHANFDDEEIFDLSLPLGAKLNLEKLLELESKMRLKA